MIDSQVEKFKALYSESDSAHYVTLSADDDDCLSVDMGYLDSQRAVEAAVLQYAHLNSVKTVRASFSRNIMADAHLVIEFTLSVIICVRDKPQD